MDLEDKTVMLYITDNGLNLAKRLNGLYPDAPTFKFNSEIVPELWNKHKALIFIMAAGIVVRTIAPLIKDKTADPAVVVLDEKGRFAISLLSGHLGGANEIAEEIADFLKGNAVITTASDINNMPSIDLWARENDLALEDREIIPHIAIRFLNNGVLKVYLQMAEDSSQESEIKLPEGFLEVSDPTSADLLITNKNLFTVHDSHFTAKGQLYLRPKNLVVGIGCNSGTSEMEIEDAVKKTLEESNLSFLSIYFLATIDKKAGEKGLVAFAQKYGFSITTFTSDELNTVEGIEKSEAVFKSIGAQAVAEPAALLASGSDKLLVPKQKIGNVTVAAAEKNSGVRRQESEKKGKIYIVGTGPGSIEYITPHARDAIRKSKVIVGYDTYLDLIKELIMGKEIISTGMTQEIERCEKAIEIAMTGKTVSAISGGDPGIYAMAGLVFEILKNSCKLKNIEHRTTDCEQNSSLIDVEVIPGIAALNACASRLGAPLMHDFAVISLSDRLTPWELIEKRLGAVSMADFVIVIHNPRSAGRPDHISKARDTILKHRSPETPVGIVKAAMREGERVVITNLKNMIEQEINMQTTVIIGNSQTFVWEGWMITPRGYENKFKIWI
jgi:cobalt-precorrin 5A hydrolase/precorrin-3B C17-methyltransferase